MSYEALRASIEGRFNDNWTLTPVAYENVPFTPGNDPWVRLTIITGESVTAGIQGTEPAVDDRGLVAIQIFVPEGTGTRTSKTLAWTARGVYEHARFDGILMQSASVTAAGVTDGWHQSNITIPFRRVRNV